MLRTYVDTNVWIAVAQGKAEAAARALTILDDPTREALFSDYVRLESLPKPHFHRRQAEVDALNTLFEAASKLEVTRPEVVSRAIEIAATHDVQPMDALHLSVALLHGADEFVTFEQSTKPMFRITDLRMTSLYQGDAG
jgi:hypothetical protein